jgi:hypothetical protein
MVNREHEGVAAAATQPQQAERLPWTLPKIESAAVGQETAATNLKIVNESVNSLS